jgi:tRNA dimethylallyltransferase
VTLVTILGPTASGKTDLAIELAKYLGDSWVVGCDSRQVFKQLDLGTGKVEGSWKYFQEYDLEAYSVQSIPHFLIDYVELTRQNVQNYSLIQYYKDFYNLFYKTKQKPKYVILVGGTAWYAKSIYKNIQIFETKSEFESDYQTLKSYIANQSMTGLHLIYQLLVSQNTCFEILNQSDYKNPERLKNTILRSVSKQKNWQKLLPRVTFEKTFNLVLHRNPENLKKSIQDRLVKRLEEGMLREIQEVCTHLGDLSTSLGLEYKVGQAYLQGYLNYPEFLEVLSRETLRYSKRQKTWLTKQGLLKVSSLDDIVHILT